jgi:hypothetical protein
VALLRDHIDKEHGIVFPLAEAVLDEAAVRWVARAFAEVEAEQGSAVTLEHAEAVLDRLEAALAVPAP